MLSNTRSSLSSMALTSFLVSINLDLMGTLTTVTLATSSVVQSIHRDTTELKGNFAVAKREVRQDSRAALQNSKVRLQDLKVTFYRSKVILQKSKVTL